jgi:hypothetical protein
MTEATLNAVPHILTATVFSILENFSVSATNKICRGIWIILVTVCI